MNDVDAVSLKTLRGLVPFDTLSETHLVDIQGRGRIVDFDKSKIIFKRGVGDGSLHYLVDGSVDLTDASYSVKPVVGGSERGRAALDDHNPHTVTAVTTSPARLFVVPKDHVDLVLTWDQAGNYMVTELGEGADIDSDWMSSLLGSAMFAAIPPANIQQLFARFEEVTFETGAEVIRQGEPGDYFYVVKSGRCRVAREGSEEEVLAELGPGDMFGEDALVGDAPRNATVTMVSDGALMRLGKADFQALLQDPVLDYTDYESLQALIDAPDEEVQVLDVRLPSEYQQGSVAGSRNLPLQELRQNIAKLDPDVCYVVTCDGGRRSVLAAYLLSQEGLDARVLSDPPNAA